MLRIILYILVLLLSAAICARVRSPRVRKIALLTGSYVLYLSWIPWFAIVLLTSTIINFMLGESLRRKPSRLILSAGIALNLLILSTFKYLPEVSASIRLSSWQSLTHLALPLGISFWTFQAMSYLFDLYRGEELDPSFLEFALYMAFFPVTISGPICRLPDMLPQIRSAKLTPWGDIGSGFARIATGFLMTQLARLLAGGILSGDGINSGFDYVTRWSGPDAWCLAFGFALQLFFDFAGYSHMAIGAAQVLGFTIPENFARPFQSTSPSIFWTRWHMSLSFWIRDYMFFPLATMRREIWWRNFVLALSMVLFGLWHKATLLFLLWGLYHGLLLVLHRQYQKVQRWLNWNPPTFLWTALSWVVTLVVINLGWIFFRANSLSQVSQMFAAIFSPESYGSHFISRSLYWLILALAVSYAIVTLTGDLLDRYASEPNGEQEDSRLPAIAAFTRTRWYWIPPLYGLILIVVLIVTHGQDIGGAAQLMYRRF